MSLSPISLLLGMALMLFLFWMLNRRMGFISQRVEHYRDQGQPIDIRKALQGDMICEGVVYGPLGRVTSRFVADLHAGWEGTNGFMTEKFKYDNGSIQDRRWAFRVTSDDGSFEATAPDIIGTSYGRQMGSAVELKYKLRLPESSGGHVLNGTDWMYQLENGTIINRSQFRKFGIKLAEIVATIRKK